jgi:hypothetical protein
MLVISQNRLGINLYSCGVKFILQLVRKTFRYLLNSGNIPQNRWMWAQYQIQRR